MTRLLRDFLVTAAVWLAAMLLAISMLGCIPTPEGDYRGQLDPQGCFVTVGLHATYTTGRVCPDEAWSFEGAWSLEGDTVHVRFPDGTAYDLRWDGDALVDAAGTTYRRGL